MVRIVVPPDKSISNRAVIFSSLTKGRVEINNFLFAEDCLSTISVLKSLGIQITTFSNKRKVVVLGKGKFSFSPPKKALYAGNSGTTMRIMMGVLAGQGFESVLDGDQSLRSRPMNRVIRPLEKMGAKIESKEGYPPVRILPAKLKGAKIESQIASAQVKSAILLAGLHADGRTHYREFITSRDHTERMLRLFGVKVRRYNGFLIVDGKMSLQSPSTLFVPGDISSGSFFISYGLLKTGSKLVLQQVGLNPTRIGILRVIKRMGGHIRIVERVNSTEPYGNIVVKSSNLKGIRIKREEIASLIDELPIIAVMAAFAKGRTYIEAVDELRVKECDRVEAIRYNLARFGVDVRIIEKKGRTDLEIWGTSKFSRPKSIRTWSDHRISMAFAIMLAVLGMDLDVVDDKNCVGISYPEFWDTLNAVSKGENYGC